MKIKELTSSQGARLARSFRRFPLTMGLALLACLGFILFFKEALGAGSQDQVLKYLHMGQLGLAGSLATLVTYLYMEGLRANLKKNRFYVGFLWLINGLLLLDLSTKLQGPVGTYLTYYLGFIFTCMVAISFIGKIYQSDSYLVYLVRIIQALLQSLIRAAVLAVILLVLSLVVNLVLDQTWESASYIYVLVLAFGPFFTYNFLSRFPYHDEDLTHFRLSSLARDLAKRGIVPLVLVYTLAAYIFLISSILDGGLPWPTTVHILLWPALFTIVLMIVLQLMEGPKLIDPFKKYYPLLALPLHLALHYTLIRQVALYGLTENRYFLILLAAWASLTLIIYPLTRSHRPIILPMLLAIFFLVASLGGPLSASRLSFKSQTKRLETHLLDAGILVGGNLTPQRETPPQTQDKIMASLYYLQARQGFSQVPFMPDNFKIEDMEGVMGFGKSAKLREEEEDLAQALTYKVDNLTTLDLEGYERALLVSDLAPNRVEGKLHFSRDNNRVTISQVNSKEEGLKPLLKIDLALLRDRYLTLMRANGHVDPQDLALEGSVQGMDYKIYFTEVHFPPKDPQTDLSQPDKLSLILLYSETGGAEEAQER